MQKITELKRKICSFWWHEWMIGKLYLIDLIKQPSINSLYTVQTNNQKKDKSNLSLFKDTNRREKAIHLWKVCECLTIKVWVIKLSFIRCWTVVIQLTLPLFLDYEGILFIFFTISVPITHQNKMNQSEWKQSFQQQKKVFLKT